MKYVLEGAETERLRFRCLQQSDFENWLPLFYKKNAALFLGMDISLTPKEHCRFWFDKVFNRYENDLGGMNVLIDKKSNRLVGQCGLLIQTVREKQKMEVGYSVLPEFWGYGYATEAAKKCRDLAFERQYNPDLISIVHPDNIASASVAKKNGMQLAFPNELHHGMPANIFQITREEWKQL